MTRIFNASSASCREQPTGGPRPPRRQPANNRKFSTALTGMVNAIVDVAVDAVVPLARRVEALRAVIMMQPAFGHLKVVELLKERVVPLINADAAPTWLTVAVEVLTRTLSEDLLHDRLLNLRRRHRAETLFVLATDDRLIAVRLLSQPLREECNPFRVPQSHRYERGRRRQECCRGPCAYPRCAPPSAYALVYKQHLQPANPPLRSQPPPEALLGH
jgi:hypothetical protein